MGQQGGLGKEENWLGISEMWDERIAFEFQKSSIINILSQTTIHI
jgi:hypothetical protein